MDGKIAVNREKLVIIGEGMSSGKGSRNGEGVTRE